ncbi:hypothetical protein PoB_006336300 [Plakobranchus ocellatus]|uniref:Uncharacterized protein n=1 Tax=Plakobranchus ocellatus TaxID=259542 RepID=A0AAV4CY64_9GAST|nr:hypothetical protein PoB_006336300 [Plakobranchus ocellatus]
MEDESCSLLATPFIFLVTYPTTREVYQDLSTSMVIIISSFLLYASPQQGDLTLLGPLSGQGTNGGAGTRDRRIPADIRVDSSPCATDNPCLMDQKALLNSLSRFQGHHNFLFLSPRLSVSTVKHWDGR